MGKVFTADVGTRIILDTGQPLSGASAVSIRAKSPTGGAVVTLEADVVEVTKVQHIKMVTTLNVVGDWELQACVEFEGATHYGDPVRLPIYAILS